ncbi:MAG: hypothetical protein WA766_16555 [Candidatus Acidiferrales bacterium]
MISSEQQLELWTNRASLKDVSTAVAMAESLGDVTVNPRAENCLRASVWYSKISRP